MRTIVHLSDLHFGRIDDDIVQTLIAGVHEATPDLVAISGDLTQRAKRRQFRAAREFLDALPFPKLIVPGNHDVPLHNLLRRFVSPLGRYRQFINDNVEPVYEDDEMVVVGLNSARSWILGGGGYLNDAQVRRAAGRLRHLPPDVLKIVVSHHPFDPPQGIRRDRPVGGAKRAMATLAEVGADLFLAGHLHVVHVSQSTERYNIDGHCALVVQAGTMSERLRGEPHSFNVIQLARPHITVFHRAWDPDQRTFVQTAIRRFRHGDGGWSEEGS